MKKLTTMVFMLSPITLFAQAATVATTTAPQSLSQMIQSALFAITSAALIFITNYAKDYLINQTKKANHERGKSVLCDSFYSAIAVADVDIDVTLKDPTAKKAFMDSWLKISTVRLNNLSGFKKKDLKSWIEVQQTIFLGRYLENKKNKG